MNILIKFIIIIKNEVTLWLNETPLYCAVKNENIETIQLLLTNDKLDLNTKYILNKKIFK